MNANGGGYWRNLVNTIEPSMFGGDAALYQITLTTCLPVCTSDVEYFQTTLTGCSADTYGTLFWTAGQRIDPSRRSTFVWRVTSTDTYSDRVSTMTYNNWYTDRPNYNGGQACMHMWSGRSYTWNDHSCSNAYCSLCEIDV